MNEQDDILAKRLRQGDDGAFEQVFLQHYQRVYRLLYGLISVRETSEDLAQETFLELHRHAADLKSDVPIVAWLCRVALNKGYNLLRDQQRNLKKIESLAGELKEDPFAEILRIEERENVREVLSHMSERQQKILLMRYAGYSLAEMAAVLGVAPGSAGTLLARAEKAFAAAYKLIHPAESERSPEKRTL